MQKQESSSGFIAKWNYVDQLEELINTGTVLQDNLLLTKSNYQKLSESLRAELDIQFDKFCVENHIDMAIITKELSDTWQSNHADEAKSRRASRMSVLRQLAQYMNSQGSECYIPSKFSAKSYRVPYVMNEREIKELFTVADDYVPKVNADRFNILAEEYKVLFRFIYCCGLRVSEARKLKLEDIDFERKTALILRSKGDKDRLIYIADDVCKMCLDMLDLLHDKYHFYSEYLFPSSDPNTPLQVASINKKFQEFWKKTSGASDYKYPTVHSLRYSFVVTRMNLWMEKGENLTAMMPYLSKYLGHESVENTYYYYHQIESAFKIVRQKDQLSDRIIPEVPDEE